MHSFKLFKNADVITMNPEVPEANAFLVFGDKFAAVGSFEEIKSKFPVLGEVVDIDEKTVIPGFIETHNHLSNFALTLSMVDCSPYNNQSMQEVLFRIEERTTVSAPGNWVIGWGYDDTLFADARHLNRSDLDSVSPHNPVLIIHISGHLSYANSLSLKMAGISRDTPQPVGGTIDKDENGNPTGLLMEPAAQMMLAKLLPRLGIAEFKAILPKAFNLYNQTGITSVHDGAVGMLGQGVPLYNAYRQLETEGLMTLRIYLTTVHEFYNNLLKAGLGRGFGSDFLRIGSVKIFQDGSIQGLTAALKKGYNCKRERCGDLIMPQEELNDLVAFYHTKGLQIAVHANGDAAIESVLAAFEKAQINDRQTNLRHMIIHSQMASDNHIARMESLQIIPSYFPNHVYYWGDRHESLFLGPDRASRINPLGSSLKAGLRFTLHADTPVTPVAPLHSIHCAVNRLTRSGNILGPHECISPYDALKGFTVDAAYCSFEENTKGTISTGKLADFAVLSDNILKIDNKKIKDVQVMKTFIGGKEV